MKQTPTYTKDEYLQSRKGQRDREEAGIRDIGGGPCTIAIHRDLVPDVDLGGLYVPYYRLDVMTQDGRRYQISGTHAAFVAHVLALSPNQQSVELPEPA